MKITIEALKSNKTELIVEDLPMEIIGYRPNATFRYAQSKNMQAGFVSIAGETTNSHARSLNSLSYKIRHDNHTNKEIKLGLTMMFKDIADTIRRKSERC